MKAKLIVVSGDAKTQEIALKVPAVLGRGKEVTLALPLPLVSRRHCEIVESNGQLLVRDLGSLNGTLVNSQKISESLLPSGSMLTVGSVTFEVLYDAPAMPPGSDVTQRETSVKTKRMPPKPPAKPAVKEEPPDFVEEAEIDDSFPDLDFEIDDDTNHPYVSPGVPERAGEQTHSSPAAALPTKKPLPPSRTEPPVKPTPTVAPASPAPAPTLPPLPLPPVSSPAPEQIAIPLAAPTQPAPQLPPMPLPFVPEANPAVPMAYPVALPETPMFADPHAQPAAYSQPQFGQPHFGQPVFGQPPMDFPPAQAAPEDSPSLDSFLKNLR